MFNFYGFYVLFAREVWRFLKVAIQTLLTPVITVLLYLLIFSSVIADSREMLPGVGYLDFLIPGLMVMAMLQNGFANSSSSLFQSRLNGNIVFVRLAPISNFEFFPGLRRGGGGPRPACRSRGLAGGGGLFAFGDSSSPAALALAGCASAALGALGLVSAIIADKWGPYRRFQNFVIVPFSFLSGVFFTVSDLPDFWARASYCNPFFYLVDGFRGSCLGVSEVALPLSLMVAAAFSCSVRPGLWLCFIVGRPSITRRDILQ